MEFIFTNARTKVESFASQLEVMVNVLQVNSRRRAAKKNYLFEM
jgi:hypothetical protein